MHQYRRSGEGSMSNDQPATPLRAARLALDWKQSRVISMLRARAERDGLAIAGPASLKTMLSRWENGNGQPDATYQRLLCHVYDRSAGELGFGDAGARGRGIR